MNADRKLQIKNELINTIISKKAFIKRCIIVFILMFFFIRIGMDIVVSSADSSTKKSSFNSRVIQLTANNKIKKTINDMTFEIECSLNNRAKLYSYAEVSINIINKGAYFAGVAQVGIPQSKEGTLYTKDFDIAANGNNTIKMYIPVNIMADKIKCEILNRSGKSIYKENIDLKIYDQDTLLVGVLADKPDQVKYIATEKNSRYLYFDNSTVPTDYRALDAIDIFIINRYNVSSLSRTQYMAITDWIKNGGTVVIGTGQGAGTYLGYFSKTYNMLASGVQNIEISFMDRNKNEIIDIVKEEIIADNYEIDETIWNNFWTTVKGGKYTNQGDGIEVGAISEKKNANMAVISAYYEKIRKCWLKTAVAEISIENGVTIESASSIPIIQSLVDGKGKIIVSSFDLAINDKYKELRKQISSTLCSYASVDNKTLYNKFLESILGSTKGKTPKAIVYIIILIVYTILVLVTFILLNMKNKTKKMLIVLPIYSCLVCIVFACMGIGTRISKLHSSHLSITQLQENGRAQVEKFFDITVPVNKIYKLKLKKNDEVYSANISTDNSALISSENDTFNTYVTSKEQGVDIRFDGISTFDTKTFKSNGSIETDEKFVTKIDCWNNEYSGVIQNKTKYDYDYVFILTKTAVLYLGDLEKNEKYKGGTIKHINYTSLDELDSIIPVLMNQSSKNRNSLDSKGKVTPNGITRAMQNYMISNSFSRTDKAYVFAITKDSGEIFDKVKIEEEGIDVITSVIDINYTTNVQRYIPNICTSDITFEFGNYNYSSATGSVYVVKDTVADYNIGKNEKIVSMEYLSDSNMGKKESRSYKGKISFWNYTTKKYDEIFSSSENRTITDLNDYVGKNKIIKIRFDVESDEKGCNLPIITAVVTK